MLAPPGNEDWQFQQLTVHQGGLAFNLVNGYSGYVALKLVGQFDPDKLPGFNPLSAVPLETYYPPVVTGANATSRKALERAARAYHEPGRLRKPSHRCCSRR